MSNSSNNSLGTPSNLKLGLSKHRSTITPTTSTPKVKRVEIRAGTDIQQVKSASNTPSSRKASILATNDGENSPSSTCSLEASPFRMQRLPTMNVKSRFTMANNHVFEHVEGAQSKPLNYGSPAMTQDTFQFLDHVENSDIAPILRDLFFGKSFNIEGKSKKEVDRLALEYARLLELCLDEMLSSTLVGDRIVWQTRLFNLIHQVYQAEFGDIAMRHVKERMLALLKRYPVISEHESDAQKQAGLGEMGIAIAQDAKLSTYMKNLRQDKYCKKTNKDLEFECMNGKVAIPSELSALGEILKYVKKIESSFENDLQQILEKEGGINFKYNVKGYERAAYKMNEYADSKPRPAFDHLMDMIRCRAVYEDIAQIKKTIQAISKKYKIVSIKDKINTTLKNVTVHFVYQEVIAEAQLACGSISTEYHSHKLYEVCRCQRMSEIFEVVLGWGDYNFDEFTPCNFWMLPTKNVEPKSLFSMQESIPHAILKSYDHGMINEEQVHMDCEDNPRSACWQNIQQLVCQYDSKSIQAVSLRGNQVIGDYEIEKHILPSDDLVQNITGTYSQDSIKSLEFLTKKGKIITFGKTQGDKKFDMRVPKHMTVLGIYYTWCKTGIQSIACWFGENPIASRIPAIAKPEEALPDLGLRCKCETCNYELFWEWNDDKERRCHMCRSDIEMNAGYADCVRTSNPICSACYSKIPGAKDLPNILQLKCPKGTLYKWKSNTPEGFKCNECNTNYGNKSGFFVNDASTSKICSGCYKKKGTIQQRGYYDTFPVVPIDKPCTQCNKDLIWYWNVKLLGRASEEFVCKECNCSYPLTAGCYNCKACEYDLCSSCYRSSKEAHVSNMPNFLDKKCEYSHYLTWQYSNDKAQWQCKVCELTYPPGAGCYTCPDTKCVPHKECASCYLEKFINFNYDDFNHTVITPEQIEQLLRNGKFRAAVKCDHCTGVCYWLWNTKIVPRYCNKNGFICSNHKEEVPHNFGAYHCFKCNVDICSQCYYVDMKKALPSLPSDRKECPSEGRLEWKNNFGSNWSCDKCKVVSPGKQSGYVCSFSKCGCNGYKICPGCYIDADQKIKGGIDCDSCNVGYHWEWDLRELGEQYAHGWNCTYCKRHTCRNEGGFHCDLGCNNDVCARCMDERNEGSQTPFPSNTKCIGNTAMTWKSTSEFTWYCQWCVRKMPPESGSFSCRNSKCKCKAAQCCSSCYAQYYL